MGSSLTTIPLQTGTAEWTLGPLDRGPCSPNATFWRHNLRQQNISLAPLTPEALLGRSRRGRVTSSSRATTWATLVSRRLFSAVGSLCLGNASRSCLCFPAQNQRDKLKDREASWAHLTVQLRWLQFPPESRTHKSTGRNEYSLKNEAFLWRESGQWELCETE